jgi:hypothetical protein
VKALRIIEGASFGPDVLEVVRKAFDTAGNDIFHCFSPEEYEEARAVLAKAVLMAARDDATDPQPLRECGVLVMKSRYPNRFADHAGVPARPPR